MKAVAETLGVARSNLIDQLKGKTKPRRRYHKAHDAELMPRIVTLVTARPTYGYRRITAILNSQLLSECLAPVNHKRVYRIMQAHSLLLARTYTERPEHVHDGNPPPMAVERPPCMVHINSNATDQQPQAVASIKRKTINETASGSKLFAVRGARQPIFCVYRLA